jgi:hypothetical protein
LKHAPTVPLGISTICPAAIVTVSAIVGVADRQVGQLPDPVLEIAAMRR